MTSHPSVNFTPRIIFGNWLWPSRRRQVFCAPSTSLNTMASAVRFERHPFERIVLCRTLDRYESFDFLHGPWTRRVYKRGMGPAVIIIHEIPGLNPLVVRFADRVADAGMTVYLPS